MTGNIASLLDRAVRKYPSKVAILAGVERVTYADFDRQACRFARVLSKSGVGRGDIIALLLPNTPLFPVCYYGALKLGAVVMPLHARSAAPEIGFALRDTDAVALISVRPLQEAAIQGWADAGTQPHLLLAGLSEEDTLPPSAHRLEAMMNSVSDADACSVVVEAIDDAADAVILFTSGTTSFPKGVRLSHRNLRSIASQFAELCSLNLDDVLLLFMPASVIVAQILLNVAVLFGASLSLMNGFDAEQLISTIRRHRVTFFPSVPMVAKMMLALPLVQSADLSSLRSVMIGGTSVHPELVLQFTDRFNIPVIIPYGLTECSTVALALPGMNPPAGSVGKPIPGTSIRIIDDQGNEVGPNESGEILVRSPHVMQGYFNRLAETKAAFLDGWLRTGDVGYLDEAGFLFIVERLSDLIKTAGNRVFPAEVERVLEMHPDVAQAAVVGKPHAQVGEVVQAFVVLNPGAQATNGDLAAHCRQRLVSYKRPRRIVFRDQLPRNSTGKVMRRKLRDE